MVTNSSSAQIDLYREVLTILVQVDYDTLIVLPLRKCSRQIRAIASTVSITPQPPASSSRAAHEANYEESILGGQNCTPSNILHEFLRTVRNACASEPELTSVSRKAPGLMTSYSPREERFILQRARAKCFVWFSE